MNQAINFPVQIIAIERLNNSTSGNPRFRICLDDQIGWAGEFVTMSDAAFCYAVGNRDQMSVGSWVTVEFTRAGRIRNMAPAVVPKWKRL